MTIIITTAAGRTITATPTTRLALLIMIRSAERQGCSYQLID